MKVFREIKPLQDYLQAERFKGKSIGLVPTMGALHQGHISLVEKSKLDNEITVATIYVNPTQFNNAGDLKNYPKAEENDLKLLQKEGCDTVFIPSNYMMYPQGISPVLSIQFGEIETKMEGKHRAGHFRGVGLVVSKLFNIIRPNRAYFGQKDFQQYLIIKKLADELYFDLEVISCPIVRERDGLAMSSRNVRLTEAHRKEAVKLFESLTLAKKLMESGEAIDLALQKSKELLAKSSQIQLEYLELGAIDTLNTMKTVSGRKSGVLCLAAFLGEVRLIDNVIVNFTE